MKTLKLWRTFKEGKTNFYRNGWLTFATVSILALSLFIVGRSVLFIMTTQSALQEMRGKMSVNVSFNPDVSEERILEIKNELSKYTKEIASVEYVSRDKALETFLSESGNDPVVAQAVKEIGENPLLASLIVKAVTLEDYPLIVSQIQNSTFQNDISRINYDRYKQLFERVESRSQTTKKESVLFSAMLVFVAIIITFNTIRITIYSHRQEFEIMRLVGASNIYVRMPFVFEGALYGLVASMIAIILLFGFVYYSASAQDSIMMNLFLGSFWSLFGGLILLGISLGVVSSAIAIRRYLKA